MAKRGISITTEHGTDEDGKLIYTADEHAKLKDATDRMSEEQYDDWFWAGTTGSRIVDRRGSSEPRQWTRKEYEAASKRTHKMSKEEFADWEAAPDEGRITD